MSPNIPEADYLNPNVVAHSEVVTSGVSIPGANRTLCIMGEGRRREVIVNFAAGYGQDGFNATYTSTSGADGRHFLLKHAPIVSNRTEIRKNGAPLTILEGPITGATFSNRYDAKVDTTTGQIELQRARIYNQGGADYVPSSANTGDGTITSLTLTDDNAPEETWTVRCTAVRRDTYGNPIDGYGIFTVTGSVSGKILNESGAPIMWQSDGVVRTNDVLRFAISEGSTPFEVNDIFTIRVVSGVLKAGDNLIAHYIATLDVNDPEFFTDMDQIVAKHGLPSTDNTLSLGCQIAFANSVPGVYCIQCAPGIPRRVTYTLAETATGGKTAEDLTFPLPVGVVPDTDSSIKFFYVNRTTGVRTQILPNKVDFFTAEIEADISSFIIGGTYAYSYTVVNGYGLVRDGENGSLTLDVPEYAYFADDSVVFNTDDAGSGTYKLIITGSTSTNNSPVGGFEIVGVSDGKLRIHRTSGSFTEELNSSTITWEIVDTATETSKILLTEDLAPAIGQGLECMVIDTRDATFYDAGWISALEKLETVNVDMIVPLPKQTISAIMQSTMAHCISMSRLKNGKERVLLTGAVQGLLPVHVTGEESAAVEDLGVLEGIQGDDPLEIQSGNIEDLTNYSVRAAYGSTYRCIYMYPDQILVSVSGTNTYLDGFYMAAALGGWLSATGNVAMPVTNKVITGFSIPRSRTFSTIVAENITREGIVLVEPVLGGGRVVWGKTTSQSGFPEEEEISILFIRDKIAKVCREALRGFIGLPESPTLASNMLVRVNGLLTAFINQGLITAFSDVTVAKDSVEPRQWNVRFKVTPTYPINWIYIRFEVGS